MKDIFSNSRLSQLLAAATYSADNTPVSVDLQGFQSAMIALQIGAGGITFTTVNKIEFVLTHSNDDVTFTPVAQADVQGMTVATGGIIKALTAAHAAAAVYRAGYIGNRRYLRLLADFSGTHATGTILGAQVVLSDPHVAPVAAQP